MQRSRLGILFAAVMVTAPCGRAQAVSPIFDAFYQFTGSDGSYPSAPVAIGTGGVLYSTALQGGSYNDGTVFSLTPPAYPGGAWTENTLYDFPDGDNGSLPEPGLVIEHGRQLYGTTVAGGPSNNGVVFSLTPPASSDGAWVEAVLYSFTGGNDGGRPYASLLQTNNGILYGMAYDGGANGGGGVFQLIR
jgi:uncharacterized repeat protein (TIGR03803 family)